MECQDLNQGQKFQVILCDPLEKTERALLRRSDVEIKRGSNLNLMVEMVNEIYDCDGGAIHRPTVAYRHYAGGAGFPYHKGI